MERRMGRSGPDDRWSTWKWLWKLNWAGIAGMRAVLKSRPGREQEALDDASSRLWPFGPRPLRDFKENDYPAEPSVVTLKRPSEGGATRPSRACRDVINRATSADVKIR